MFVAVFFFRVIFFILSDLYHKTNKLSETEFSKIRNGKTEALVVVAEHMHLYLLCLSEGKPVHQKCRRQAGL